MEKVEIKIEIDHDFLNAVIKNIRRSVFYLRVIDFVTFGIFKDRIKYQYEVLEKLLSEAVAESITVK